MTLERWLILAFAIINGLAGVIAAGAVAAGLPLYTALLASALVVGTGTGLAILRSWFDAAPPPPR